MLAHLQVKLSMSDDVPLMVEYPLKDGELGFMRFYLAPKVVQSLSLCRELLY